jgi:hypothetical protein
MNEKILQRRKDTAAAYRRLFETEDGKIVLRDLVRKGFLARTIHVVGDPVTSAWNEGQRTAVLGILKAAKVSDARLVEAIQAEHERQDL